MSPPLKSSLFPQFLQTVSGFSRIDPIIAAISGGLDSVVLLHLLVAAKFTKIIVAHFNHGLRPEAVEDAAFVASIARNSHLPFIAGRGNTKARAAKYHESIEEAARNLRRNFYTRTAKKFSAKSVFLAHHAGDAAETLLFNLARGSGTRGLSSIRPEIPLAPPDIKIIRPLLTFNRQEIEAYATLHNLDFHEDASNSSREFTRNRLRHDVIPALAEAMDFNPIPPLARTAAILAAEDEWMESLVAEEATLPTLSTRALAAMPVARQRRLLLAWINHHSGCSTTFETVERARSLALSTSSPAKINLPKNLHLRRRAGVIFIQ